MNFMANQLKIGQEREEENEIESGTVDRGAHCLNKFEINN